MRTFVTAIFAGWAAGCNGNSPSADGGDLVDTGWFTDSDDPLDPENCTDKLVSFSPEDGEAGWYWRDRPEVFVESTNRDAYTAWLQTADGERLDTTMVWDEASGLSFTLEWEGQLEPSTPYTLGLEDCASAQTITFTTSDLGTPLEMPVEDLVGNTYLIDLVGATWVQPAALAGVLQTYFNTPILLGVTYANDDDIKLVGAPGETDPLGNVSQSNGPVWIFPLADFTEAPYLDVTAPQIEFQYEDGNTPIRVPVESFALAGTLSSDGSRLGGGVLSGLGDSRYLGEEILGGDPGDLCTLAAGLGVECVPCADGEVYCLELVARDLEASLLPELVITE
jgi:hypothetical protein